MHGPFAGVCFRRAPLVSAPASAGNQRAEAEWEYRSSLSLWSLAPLPRKKAQHKAEPEQPRPPSLPPQRPPALTLLLIRPLAPLAAPLPRCPRALLLLWLVRFFAATLLISSGQHPQRFTSSSSNSLSPSLHCSHLLSLYPPTPSSLSSPLIPPLPRASIAAEPPSWP